ncbi:MAG: hypothetical protein ACKV2T_28200 [Kofleriaceae bacterium]
MGRQIFMLGNVMSGLAMGCGDSGGGPGTTSAAERVEATLPLPDTACFTKPLLDILPNTPGDQFECTALLDGNVLPPCGASEPCWEIVTATSGTCMDAPSVRGGTDGQMLSIDCVVEE